MTEYAQTLTLWGTPHSLYTGKVRSYLIKKGLPFREMLLSHPRFRTQIVSAVRLIVAPVLELPDGELIQDSTDILAALERRFPDNPMFPATPVQACVAHLLDGFGSEGLLAAAMHYRWSYRAEQEQFLRAEFGRAVRSGPDREGRLAAGAALMDYFNGFLPLLGVTPETIPAVEAAYLDLLDALDVHFQHYPYLLGGRPSIADFGFMAPLFAHLGRDPVPAMLMTQRAPNVYRWTERMNLVNIADGEFPDCAESSYLAGYAIQAIQATLEPVLALLFRDWGHQLLADAEHHNAWVDSHADLPAGQLVGLDGERKVHPSLGLVVSDWRGARCSRASAPHALWLLDKALACAAALSAPVRERFAWPGRCSVGIMCWCWPDRPVRRVR
ncbi:glutathione S-transferase family protein [Pseudomonas sp. LjRoot71]|uniref:glutathione S-transferase family protein n=1 Tax=Pseudomonas TaxID=286 RepID=UPI00193E0660|nr:MULTISPECIES: glutathione S-transferase family protein [Pseudomonas]MBM3110007.1 glutathione S-transferase family protein [Pseudomonas arcuscaelestis]